MTKRSHSATVFLFVKRSYPTASYSTVLPKVPIYVPEQIPWYLATYEYTLSYMKVVPAVLVHM
eukprot:1628169-Pleurochrysis_carterae.AAC.1